MYIFHRNRLRRKIWFNQHHRGYSCICINADCPWPRTFPRHGYIPNRGSKSWHNAFKQTYYLGTAKPRSTSRTGQRSQKLGSEIFEEGIDFRAHIRDDGSFDFIWQGEQIEMPAPSLQGVHQVQNAGLAVAAMKMDKRWSPPKNINVLAKPNWRWS